MAERWRPICALRFARSETRRPCFLARATRRRSDFGSERPALPRKRDEGKKERRGERELSPPTNDDHPPLDLRPDRPLLGLVDLSSPARYERSSGARPQGGELRASRRPQQRAQGQAGRRHQEGHRQPHGRQGRLRSAPRLLPPSRPCCPPEPALTSARRPSPGTPLPHPGLFPDVLKVCSPPSRPHLIYRRLMPLASPPGRTWCVPDLEARRGQHLARLTG